MLTVLFFVAALAAQSDDSRALDDCMQHADGISSKMLACGKAEIDRWDPRLNAAYRALMAKASPQAKKQLQAEQRAWLSHHLNETHRLAADPNTGSGALMLSQNFELDDLKKRTLELEARMAAR